MCPVWVVQVGPPYLMHREDMEKVAPLWYNFTYAVRNDPQVNSLVLPSYKTSCYILTHCQHPMRNP